MNSAIQQREQVVSAFSKFLEVIPQTAKMEITYGPDEFTVRVRSEKQPKSVVEQTRGIFRHIDPHVLRQIIEDEDLEYDV